VGRVSMHQRVLSVTVFNVPLVYTPCGLEKLGDVRLGRV
jgi:hypothetical protein